MVVARDGELMARIRDRLEREMSRVRDEIRRYPAPIPACDAQFNYLLESRQVLSDAIARLRELENGGAQKGDRTSFEAIFDSPHDLGGSLESEIRTMIENEARETGSRQ